VGATDPGTDSTLGEVKSETQQLGLGNDTLGRAGQQQFAIDWSRAQPGSAAYQAAGPFYEAFLNMLGPGGGGGQEVGQG
jgi:hypothetical protein